MAWPQLHPTMIISRIHDFLEIHKKAFDDLALGNYPPRLGLLEAPLALALYKTCPPVLQQDISDKATKLAKTNNPVLRTGPQIALMIPEHFKTE